MKILLIGLLVVSSLSALADECFKISSEGQHGFQSLVVKEDSNKVVLYSSAGEGFTSRIQGKGVRMIPGSCMETRDGGFNCEPDVEAELFTFGKENQMQYFFLYTYKKKKYGKIQFQNDNLSFRLSQISCSR